MKNLTAHILLFGMLLPLGNSFAQEYQLVLTNTQNEKTQVLEEGQNVAFNIVGRDGIFNAGKLETINENTVIIKGEQYAIDTTN